MRSLTSAPLRGLFGAVIFVTATLAAVAAPSIQAPTSATPRKPNVVLILIDDMGWRDPGFVSNHFIETPAIDRLASEGAVFSQCYASAPNCAPSRACLLTGQYPPRHGVYTVVDERYTPGQPYMKVLSTAGNDELPDRTVTLAEALKQDGYATALIGMWNLGHSRNGTPGNPTGQGFEVYHRPDDFGFAKDAYHNAQGRYLSDALAEDAVAWIEQNQAKPFFLYFADHSVHEPFDPKPELLAKYQRKTATGLDRGITPEYAATCEAADQSVGRIMAALQRLGLDDNTLVIFTSDNGGLPYVVNPLRGSKGLLYEGGLRVPGAVRWPGVIPAGKVFNEPVLGMDFMPTILDAAGLALPATQPTDGVSLMSQLRKGAPLNRTAIFWHFPCYIGKGEPMSLVRAGDYKLIEKFAGPTYELYNVKADPSEANDLVREEPAKLEELKSMLSKWQQDTGAFLADQPNPAYDPNAQSPRGGGGRQAKGDKNSKAKK
jgi:arylsulfatase A